MHVVLISMSATDLTILKMIEIIELIFCTLDFLRNLILMIMSYCNLS